MLYLIALFIPPLGILLAGRILTSIVVAVFWLVGLVLFFPAHLLLVVVAWIVIGQSRNDRRHKETIAAIRDGQTDEPR